MLIRFLRGDIAAFDKLLMREVFEDGIIVNDLLDKLKTIRTNIINSEKQFNELKLEFNQYLLEYTSAT
jgi:predicted RNA-binding protein